MKYAPLLCLDPHLRNRPTPRRFWGPFLYKITLLNISVFFCGHSFNKLQKIFTPIFEPFLCKLTLYENFLRYILRVIFYKITPKSCSRRNLHFCGHFFNKMLEISHHFFSGHFFTHSKMNAKSGGRGFYAGGWRKIPFPAFWVH